MSVDCPSEEIFVPSNSSCQSQVLHAEPETSIIDDPLPALLSPVIPLPVSMCEKVMYKQF